MKKRAQLLIGLFGYKHKPILVHKKHKIKKLGAAQALPLQKLTFLYLIRIISNY